MNSCNLQEIPSFQSLSNLKDLSLNSNNLHVIKSKAFIGGNQLSYLSLSSNQIEVVEDEAFSNLLLLQVKNKQRAQKNFLCTFVVVDYIGALKRAVH